MTNPQPQPISTRTAIIDAFKRLVLDESFEDIRVGDIIRHSDVGRSTFYDHFQDKYELLRQSLNGILTVLVSTVDEGTDLDSVKRVLEHFFDNRQLVVDMLRSPTIAMIARVFANLIEERLPQESEYIVPKSLIAAQIAEAILGIIQAWLLNSTDVTTSQLTTAITTGARALRHAYQIKPLVLRTRNCFHA